MVTQTPRRLETGRLLGELVDSVLLAAVVLAPARAVATINLDRTLPFEALVWISLIALACGALAAYSGVKDWLAQTVGTVLGFGGVIYVIARVIPDMPLDATTSERLAELGAEATQWYRTVASGNQATNNLLFLLLLALVAWTVGFYSAWAVFHERSAWWPVTVSATSLTLILATFPDLYPYMVVELIAAMLLIGRMNLEARRIVWDARGIRQGEGFGGKAFRSSLALAIGLVALAWLIPTALASKPLSQSLGQSRDPWRDAQTSFHRAFGGLQSQNEAALSGFGRAMTLHGSFHLADTPVLSVEADRPEYWRAVVFDQYTGHGWLSSDPIDQRTIPSGANVLNVTDRQRADVTQVITVLVARGNDLVGASQPVAFNRLVSAQAFGGGSISDGVDLVSVASVRPIQAATRYTVLSSVSIATADQLRAAGQNYPGLIRQRYLSLPPIPNRVRLLAQRTTAGSASPYDKAVAVESYLRAMPYSLDLPSPPPDRDAVDYFLFDARTGYCDYFASSMAVMLRSEGIPARVVSGYATGERQSDGSFLVKDSDSHTWVEVYFPGYGWVPFEPSGGWPRAQRGPGSSPGGGAPITPPGRSTPTAAPPNQSPSQSPSQSGISATPTPTPSPTPEAGANPSDSPKRPAGFRPGLPLLAILGVLAAFLVLAWYLWERDLRGFPPPVVAYAKMTRLASLLGFAPRRSETPVEYARALSAALPDAGSNVHRIASEYARLRFGHHDPDERDRALRLWRFVRNALLRKIGRLRRS